MDEWPSVSVVIPARNEAANIRAAVESALAQDYEGPLEVLVADGRSTDGTAELVRALGTRSVRLIDNPSGRTPDGLNRAIAASTGEVIVRCDAHSELPSGYIETAVRTLIETGADNVGGVQAAEGVTPMQRAIAYSMSSRVGAGDATFHYGGEPGPTDTVYLGVFRRSALDRVGGFDGRLERNQDYELNIRIRESGGVVWLDPELRVTYRPRATLLGLARQYHQYGRWKRVVVQLHPASVRWRQLVAPTFVIGLAGSILLLALGHPLGWLVPTTYGLLVTTTGLARAYTEDDLAACMMPLSLATMHVAWGTGFIRGNRRWRRHRYPAAGGEQA